MRRWPDATRAEIRDALVTLVLPGLLIIGGSTLALGKREKIPRVSHGQDSRPDDYWQDADDEEASPRDVGCWSTDAP
jgi:hypothetical protein